MGSWRSLDSVTTVREIPRNTAPEMWLKPEYVEDLIKSLDQHGAKLSDEQMCSVGELIHETMHVATMYGKETASLAMTHQVSKVVEYVAARMTGVVKDVRPRGDRVERKRGKRGAERKTETDAKKKARLAAERKAPAEKGKGDFKDVDGALGPNGLPRMKGGNPAGDSCKLARPALQLQILLVQARVGNVFLKRRRG